MPIALSRKFTLAALAAGAIAASAPACAMPTADVFCHAIIGSIDYREMGYLDEDGNWVSAVGQRILGGYATVHFDPETLKDVKVFHMTMVVPVSGARSQYFAIEPNQLVPLGGGRFRADFTSNDFNGIVIAGRFSVETYGMNAKGDMVTLHGTLEDDSGFHFTVTRP